MFIKTKESFIFTMPATSRQTHICVKTHLVGFSAAILPTYIKFTWNAHSSKLFGFKVLVFSSNNIELRFPPLLYSVQLILRQNMEKREEMSQRYDSLALTPAAWSTKPCLPPS